MSDYNALSSKVNQARELLKQRDALLKYADVMSENYTSSLRIIIDISEVLQIYNDIITEFLVVLEDAQIDTSKLSELDTLASDRVSQIREAFQKDFSKLYDFVSKSTNKPEYLENLKKVKETFETTLVKK